MYFSQLFYILSSWSNLWL